MTWYEEWFNSDYYLQLYSHRDDIEAEACIDLILRASQVRPAKDRQVSVLDIGAGPGRHAIDLARRGFAVTAVDISTPLLHYAHREAEREKVKVRLLQLDMRSLSFDHEFDLVVQLFSSFGYFDTIDEDMAVLRGARRALKGVGWYAIDLMNPTVLHRTLVPKNTRTLDDGTKVTEERAIEGDRVVKTITIAKGKEKHHYHESVHLYSPEQIEWMVREAGFLPTHWYGDYAGQPFDPEKSRRMIVICKTV